MAKQSNLREIQYNRGKAVAYANEWAYRRNPAYYDFSEIGGDCTNFASQCIYAGCGVMNFRPTYGWYYIGVNDRAPAWTSVKYLYQFLTTNEGAGPYGTIVDLTDAQPGDLAQIRFIGAEDFGHSPIITLVSDPISTNSIEIAAHTTDCNGRPISTYRNVAELRFIHILGVRQPQ